MKRILLFYSLIFLFSSCAKTDDCDSLFKYSPAEYSLYLELKDGEVFFENKEVSISNQHEMQNGELSPIPFFNNEVIWEPLYRVDDNYLNFETVVFGNKVTNSLGHTFFIGIHVGTGPSSECGYESGAHWDRNSYYLLKFPDSTVDTLRVRDKKEIFNYPEYTIYLNGEAVNYQFYPQNYITIQK